MDLWLDAAGARALPPAGQVDDGSFFGILGGRLYMRVSPRALIDLAVSGGESADSAAGSWITGSLAAETMQGSGRNTVSLRGEAFGLRYAAPFDHTVYGFDVVPHIATRAGAWTVALEGRWSRGRWSSRETPDSGDGRPIGPSFVIMPLEVSGPLALSGGSIEIRRAIGRLSSALTGAAYHATNSAWSGWYGGPAVEVELATGALSTSAAVRWWRSPAGTEFGYQVDGALALSPDIIALASVGRTVADPRFGTAGSFAASLGLSWRLAERSPAPPRRAAEVVGPVDGARRVRFRLRSPDAEQVAVAGSFSGWNLLPLQRRGDEWTLEIELPPGTYQYAFLVDGASWTLPPEATGIVDDGWGRKNATLVVPE